MVDISAYPDGNITFVFTDIEGSSRTTSELEKVRIGTYEEHLRDPHRQRLLECVNTCNGHEIHRAGDGHLFVFKFAEDALNCVVSLQQSLHADPITHTEGGKTYEVKVRVGVHTATLQRKPTKIENGLPEYPGSDTNYAARVGGLGIGGQIIVSQSAYSHARKLIDYENPPCAVASWPGRFLKSFPGSHLVYEILYFDGQQPFEPGMRWFAEWYRSERNRFVDRPEKEAEVTAGFDAKKVRIVTITGIGGSGKTRLAIACAAKRANLYDDGVYFVSLATADLVEKPEAVAASRNVEFVAQVIGAALNVQGEAAQPEPLFQMLRTKNVLLVLDNYESVHCDEVSRYLIKLTTETPGVSLLVTGRERVDVDDMEAIVSLNDGMASNEARLLFLDRARLKRSMPETLSSDDESHLKRILELTECIPLALELAAARIDRYSLKQIANGIEATPLDKMGTAKGHRVDDEISHLRHRSLERSLTWSYNLLSEEAQRVLATTSLFTRTFDAETLETVHGSDEADDGLTVLIDASLVYEDNTSQAADGYRFRLHRATRFYAAERLVALSSADDTRRRFVAYYCLLVIDNDSLNNAEHRYVLTVEWRNALAAVQTAEIIEDWLSVMTLANLGDFLGMRGAWLEQETLYDKALVAAQKSNNRRDEGRALGNLGSVYRLRGQWDKAEDAYQQDLLICQELGDRQGEGMTLVNLGNIYQSRGEWDKAEQTYQQGFAICRELGERQGEGLALNHLGIIYYSQGQYDKAEEAFQQSLTIFREFGDRQGEGAARNHLGIVYYSRGQWDMAAEAYRQSITIFQELEDRWGEGKSLNNLGIIYDNVGQWDKAEKAYQQSLIIKRELGDRQSEGGTLENLALLMEAQEKQTEAVAFAREAVAVFAQTEDKAGLERARDTLNRLSSE